jgi:hypothetical protein
MCMHHLLVAPSGAVTCNCSRCSMLPCHWLGVTHVFSAKVYAVPLQKMKEVSGRG